MFRGLPVLASIALCVAAPAAAAEPLVRPAADAVFAAFKQHPLVGLGDAHGLAEEGEFYGVLVRDPRFAAQVGNLVMEAFGAAHQDTLDRYLNGEDVPRADLRKVWTDIVGGAPFLTGVSYQQVLAEIRAVNAKLPPARRIKVWAGEPSVDWATIKTRADLEPYMAQRDSHPAALIDREILGKRKKALVIYGGLHFFPLPAPPGLPQNPGLRGLVERGHPGAFYIISPYVGFVQPGCSEAFEAATHWPNGSLISPVKDTALQALLLRPGCTAIPPPRRAPGAEPIDPEVFAKIQAGFVRPSSGADADAILYLAPAATLTISPDDPEMITDPAYAAEITRRLPISGARPDLLSHLVTERRRCR